MIPAATHSASMRCRSTARVTAAMLLSFLAFAPTPVSGNFEQGDALIPGGPIFPSNPDLLQPAEHIFSLRHIFHHGTYLHPELHRKRDIDSAGSRVLLSAEDGHDEHEITSLRAKSQTTTIQRLRDRRPSVVDPLVAQSRRQGFSAVLDAAAWVEDEVLGPDITDKVTVVSMAYMAADSYVEDHDGPDWEEVGGPYNRTADFGWESDGLRGHIWSDDTNSTIVIGLKGTSPAVFDGDGTTTRDKLNDNLFFSCCCAQQGPWTWHQVCDCATGTYTCNNTCVTHTLRDENHYYTAARELYSNVTELYPGATVWLAGHSLGGAVSSFLALTYGLPAVTFEAVPEALAAYRLGLPVPPGADVAAPQTRKNTGVVHFGHTADPIYVGTCNGATAACSLGGYALETSCHAGRECVYDVVADKGWRVGIGTHKIRSVIKDVLLAYDTVPECKYTPECRDCAQWKMYESNGTESTTTSSSSTTTRTRTRTSTCETPGWWGCLDTTTTTTGPSTTTTITSTTSTCKTPGWFGCKDETTIMTTMTSTLPVTPTSTTTTCKTPGRFWGCKDEMTSTSASTGVAATPDITSAPTLVPEQSQSQGEDKVSKGNACLYRNWLGVCMEWADDRGGFSPDEM